MMDLFEKQQTIEAIKTAVKARWFYVSAVAFQAVIVKLMFPDIPLPSSPLITLIVLSILLSNFGIWIYLRRPAEKINSSGLQVIKGFIVFFDQIGVSVAFYFSGTANKLLFIFYFMTVMISTSFYKTKGVILATISASILYSGLVVVEYLGLMPAISPEAVIQSPYKFLRGEIILTKGQLVGFNSYLLALAIVAGYLAGLFKKREKRLQAKNEEAVKKSELLTVQTQELTKTKDYLHEALIKSDKARAEVEDARAELEKANLELKAKINELEKYGQVTTGREMKMVELKDKIKTLEEKIREMENKK